VFVVRSSATGLALYKEKQRVIAGGLKMPIVGTVLLFSVDQDFRTVHIQHYPLG
jgi:hypothetical protein